MRGRRDGVGRSDGAESIEEVDVAAEVLNTLDHIKANFVLGRLFLVLVLIVKHSFRLHLFVII